MRHLFISAIAVFLGIFSVNAQYKMKVTMKNGHETDFDVSEIENITWEQIRSETHEYVDLGLPSGTMWATCNVGASAPEDYGDYFAWGETEIKGTYDWSNYKYCNSSCSEMNKYCTDSRLGTVDNKTVLDIEDDVVHVKWGDNWWTPSDKQMRELIECCSYNWTCVNNVWGQQVTGPNGNSIFLPAAGFRIEDNVCCIGVDGAYMSRSLFNEDNTSSNGLQCSNGNSYMRDWGREYGLSVRPVYVDSVAVIDELNVDGCWHCEDSSDDHVALYTITISDNFAEWSNTMKQGGAVSVQQDGMVSFTITENETESSWGTHWDTWAFQGKVDDVNNPTIITGNVVHSRGMWTASYEWIYTFTMTKN